MTSIHLHTPKQTQTRSEFIDTRPAGVRAWLANLPQGNPLKTGRTIRIALIEINKVSMPPAQRRALVALFVPVVEQVTQALSASYRGRALPPTPAALHKIELVRHIHASMANACKILVSDIQRAGKLMSADNSLFAEAISYTLEFLSRQLLVAYEVYLAVPAHAWSDLHYLYLLAQRQGLLDTTPTPTTGGSLADTLTPAQRYHRALMLALTNPYHLNQGEARQLYDHLGAWACHCTLTRWRGKQCPSGNFFVDMGADAPPRYATAALQSVSVYPFVIDIHELLDVLKQMIGDLRRGTDTPSPLAHGDLAQRRLRATYERAAQAWGQRGERKANRSRATSDMLLLIGLSTCCRLFAHGTDDADESELRIMGIEEQAQQAFASLQAQEKESGTYVGAWGAEAAAAAVQHEQVIEAVSLDVVDNSRIFGGQREQTPVGDDDTSRWHQRDQSRGGIAVFSLGDSVELARVGEVIAFRPSAPIANQYANQPTKQGWTLGMVRWVRLHLGHGLEMGVRAISPDANTVTTKALLGVGTGARPGQALLIPRQDPRQHPTTLIAPPAIYDQGTILALQLEPDEVIPIQLTTLISSSDRHAHFQFQCLENPPRIPNWDVME